MITRVTLFNTQTPTLEHRYRNAVLVVNTVILTLITLYGSTRKLYISFEDSSSSVKRKNELTKSPVKPRPSPRIKKSNPETRTKKSKSFKLARCPSMSVVEGLDNKSRPMSLSKSGWSLCDEDFKVR